jgi:hypothetical protein
LLAPQSCNYSADMAATDTYLASDRIISYGLWLQKSGSETEKKTTC